MQKLLFLHEGRGKRNRRRFRRRGSACVVVLRLAGLGLSRPIETRYLWDILSRHYLLKIGRPTPEPRRRLAVVIKTGGRKPQDCGRERVCNMPPLAATCRSRWGAGGSFIKAAGWTKRGRFVYFGALAKVHGRGHPRERVLVLAARPDRTAWRWGGLAAKPLTVSSCRIPGSQPLL